MKVYKKPSLEIVKFEMNEAIASCTDSLPENLKQWYADLGITFTGDELCSEPTYDYCVHTSVSEGATAILMSS